MHTLINFFWFRIPVALAYILRAGALVMADGVYLTRWSRIAAYAPALALSTGVCLGATHFGSRGETFTFSIVFIAALFTVTSFSGGVGAWFTLGYALGDLLLFRSRMIGSGVFAGEPTTVLARVGIPALVLDGLLLALLAFVPLVSQLLTSDFINRIPARLRKSAQQWPPLDPIVVPICNGVVQGLLVYAWVHAVPTLLRPTYVWINSQPPVQAVEPLQLHGITFALYAAGLGVLRAVVEGSCLKVPSVWIPAQAIRAMLHNRLSRRRLKLPGRILILFRAAALTLAFAGLLASWTEAGIVFALIAAVLVIRYRFSVMPEWLKLVERLPVIVRLVSAYSFSLWVGNMIVDVQWATTATFRPVWISVIVCLALTAMLFPERPINGSTRF